jgi:hypothetical protein
MVNVDFSEKFQGGLLGYFYWADDNAPSMPDMEQVSRALFIFSFFPPRGILRRGREPVSCFSRAGACGRPAGGS